MIGAWLSLGACVSGEATVTDTADSDAPNVPTWSPAEVQAFVDLHLADTRPEPATLAAAYQRLLTHAEPPCPAYAMPGNPWSGWATAGPEGCTTSAGWLWYGQALGAAGCAEFIDVGVLASFEVSGPAAEVAVAGGTFQQQCSRGADEGECFGQLAGTFRFSGEGPGLDAGYTASLFVTERWSDGVDIVGMDGGMTWPDGTLAFRSVELADGVARGSIAIRDPGARWFEAVLPPSGSGCTPLAFAGEDVGELCLDLTDWSAPLGRLFEECLSE